MVSIVKQVKAYKSWLKTCKSNYEPFIKVHDLSSQGLSSIIHGFSSGRNHHLLSNLELSIFLLFDWNNNVIDIKEQYALDPIITDELAVDARIKHPVFKGENKIMSSDFLVSFNNPRHQMSFQAKYSCDLNDKRVVEKLEIERRYWKRKNIPWHIITEKQIPKTLTENVRWLQSALCAETKVPNLDEKLVQLLRISSQFKRSDKLTDFAKKIDHAYQQPIGESLADIRQLIAWRYIRVDLTKKFHTLTVGEIIDGVVETSGVANEAIG